MQNFLPVYKKELRVFFSSPIAYLVFVVFMIISAIFFILILKSYSDVSFEIVRRNYQMKVAQLNVADGILVHMFGNFTFLLLFMLPLITMRSFSDERKNGTYELMFTYPVSDSALVSGKILSAFTLFLAMLALTLPYGAVISYFKILPMAIYLTGYLGMALLGLSFISLGVFVSSLTENQVVSSFGSFGMILFFWIIGWVAGDSTMPIAEIVRYFSIFNHTTAFNSGVIDTRDIVFYLSFSVLFFLATLRVLESRRYRS